MSEWKVLKYICSNKIILKYLRKVKISRIKVIKIWVIIAILGPTIIKLEFKPHRQDSQMCLLTLISLFSGVGCAANLMSGFLFLRRRWNIKIDAFERLNNGLEAVEVNSLKHPSELYWILLKIKKKIKNSIMRPTIIMILIKRKYFPFHLMMKLKIKNHRKWIKMYWINFNKTKYS